MRSTHSDSRSHVGPTLSRHAEGRSTIATSRELLVILLCISGAGWAQDHPNPFNGAKLKSSCEASVEQQAGTIISLDRIISATACRSYLAGFIESNAFSEGALSAKRLFCIPPGGISVQDAAIVVHAFATQHQGMLDLPAAALVAASLEEQFPRLKVPTFDGQTPISRPESRARLNRRKRIASI